MSRFVDSVVLVTGGGSGIGAAVARQFAVEGARVCVLDVDGDAAERTCARLPGAYPVTADVRDRDAVRAAVTALEAEHGHVDVLVNNAGLARDVPFDAVTTEDFRHETEISLWGAMVLSQAVLPGMVARGRGSIVNVSSVNALMSLGNEVYSAAKAGLLSLTRSIATQYGPAGVRCNAVLPGTVRTPAWAQRVAADPTVFDRAARRYPLRRVGEPEDIAHAVCFLASDAAGWITGVSLPVDGGLLVGNATITADVADG